MKERPVTEEAPERDLHLLEPPLPNPDPDELITVRLQCGHLKQVRRQILAQYPSLWSLL